MGSLGSSSKLGLLVKKKGSAGPLVKKKEDNIKKPQPPAPLAVKPPAPLAVKPPAPAAVKPPVAKPAGPSGLGLLGAYSDSDTASD